MAQLIEHATRNLDIRVRTWVPVLIIGIFTVIYIKEKNFLYILNNIKPENDFFSISDCSSTKCLFSILLLYSHI